MFAHDLNSEHRKDTVDLWERGDIEDTVVLFHIVHTRLDYRKR